jgi:protein-S-isoprenylcysteine O-methyltransferase Ste14
VTEGYTLLLVLIARRASSRDTSVGAIAATVYAAFFFVLFDARGTTAFVPEMAGLALQLAGLAWQIASKITLGRSFGLLPAHRRLVVGGPYRVVRHPIYFGYLVSHVAFLGVNFSWRNFAVLAVLYIAQVYRIRREEWVLSQNPGYRAYMGTVRWRLVPGLW